MTENGGHPLEIRYCTVNTYPSNALFRIRCEDSAAAGGLWADTEKLAGKYIDSLNWLLHVFIVFHYIFNEVIFDVEYL